MTVRSRLATDAAASVADLGTLLPIAAALIVVNGVDPVAALGLAGALFIVAGFVYGRRARRVTARNLLATCGLGNVAVGMFGGMPLCHGSSGATAYYRFGGRTGAVNLVIGSALLVAGLGFGAAALDLFALIPPVVLGALLAYTGVRHAVLVTDQRAAALAIALAMGLAGGLTRNLTWAMAVGIPAYALLIGSRRVVSRSR